MSVGRLIQILSKRCHDAETKVSELVEELSCSHYPEDVIEDIEHEIDYYSSLVSYYHDVLDEIYNICVRKVVPNAK